MKQLEGLTDLVRAPLSKLARMTLGALIVIDVHARDVVQALINEKVGWRRIVLPLLSVFRAPATFAAFSEKEGNSSYTRHLSDASGETLGGHH